MQKKKPGESIFESRTANRLQFTVQLPPATAAVPAAHAAREDARPPEYFSSESRFDTDRTHGAPSIYGDIGNDFSKHARHFTRHLPMEIDLKISTLWSMVAA